MTVGSVHHTVGDRAAPTGMPRRSVFGRTLEVLWAFEDAPEQGLALLDVVVRTGLPVSTVHRILVQLVQERVLERLPDRRYRIGLRLWELGMLAPRSRGLRQAALPFLEDLHEVTRRHVQLSVLDGTEVVVVERLSTRDASPLRSGPGGRLPLHATSGGIVLLAAAEDELVRRVLREPLQAFTADTIRTEPQLRASLVLARRQGWIALRDHLTVGSLSIAAPISDGRGTVVAAVSAILDSDDGERAAPAVRMTARAISRAIAHVRPDR